MKNTKVNRYVDDRGKLVTYSKFGDREIVVETQGSGACVIPDDSGNHKLKSYLYGRVIKNTGI